MNAADEKKMKEMLDKINKDNEKLKKEMGLGDSDGEDDEIKKLAKEMHKIGKLTNSILNIYIQMPAKLTRKWMTISWQPCLKTWKTMMKIPLLQRFIANS
jgi:hypothetical protein